MQYAHQNLVIHRDIKPANVLVTHDGVPTLQGDLTLEAGPERIEAGWWDGAEVRRDYFVAGNARGETYWIYREHALNDTQAGFREMDEDPAAPEPRAATEAPIDAEPPDAEVVEDLPATDDEHEGGADDRRAA